MAASKPLNIDAVIWFQKCGEGILGV